MNFQDILNVLTIVKEKSFSKAAAKLYITQSAVSQSIAKLEAELGITLFFRNNRQVLPTKACLAFIEKAQPLVDMYNQFYSNVKLLRHMDKQHMRIGALSFFSRFLSYQNQVKNNPSKYPFDVEIVEDVAAVIEQMTVDGKIDFCFTRSPLYHSELQYETLFTEQLFLAVPSSHPVCAKYPVTAGNNYPVVDLANFKNDPFVMINNPFITPNCIKMCKEADLTPHVIANTTVWERVYTNIQVLGAVGFISFVYATPVSPETPVRFFRINSSYSSFENVVAYISRDKLSSNARIYIDSFREYLHSHLPV